MAHAAKGHVSRARRRRGATGTLFDGNFLPRAWAEVLGREYEGGRGLAGGARGGRARLKEETLAHSRMDRDFESAPTTHCDVRGLKDLVGRG